MRQTLAPGLLAALVAGALGGCGGGVTLQDDLAVQRSGATGPALELVINDAGTVSCNRRPPVRISDAQLIVARDLNTALADDARRGASRPAGAQSVFRYRVRTPDGHLSFSDDSPGLPSNYGKLQLLVVRLAQQDCHLAR